MSPLRIRKCCQPTMYNEMVYAFDYNNTSQFTVHWLGWISLKILFRSQGGMNRLKAKKCKNVRCIFEKPFFFLLRFDKSSVLFLFPVQWSGPFWISGPNSTGETILSVLVWGTCDVNIVLSKFHWTIRDCIKVLCKNSILFCSIFYKIKYHLYYLLSEIN